MHVRCFSKALYRSLKLREVVDLPMDVLNFNLEVKCVM